jgi:hypothetical protein
MYLYIIYVLLLVLILWLVLSNNKEGYWEVYTMPNGIPKTYVSPHFILNQSCWQNAKA